LLREKSITVLQIKANIYGLNHKDSLIKNMLLKTGATKLALSNLLDTHHSIIGSHLCDDKNLPTGMYL